MEVAVICILAFGILSVPAGLLITKIKAALSGEKVPNGIKVLAFLPYINLYVLAGILSERNRVYKIILTLPWVCILFRAVSILLINTAPALIVYSAVAMLVGIALILINYMVITIHACTLLQCGWFHYVLALVVSPLEQYILSLKVVPYFKKLEDDVNGTFSAEDSFV